MTIAVYIAFSVGGFIGILLGTFLERRTRELVHEEEMFKLAKTFGVFAPLIVRELHTDLMN